MVVQHMPPIFTRTYAESLAKICSFEVKEAQDGDKVVPGRCLIAPGDFHMELARSGIVLKASLHQKPPLHSVRPAADYLMKTVARQLGPQAIGIVLTGMGKDGAEGLLEMRKAGAYTIAQDEKSSIVYGMPKAAADCGAVMQVASLEEISSYLASALNKNAAA